MSLGSGGHVVVVHGPMCAGKTSESMRQARRYELVHKCPPFVVKPLHDTRGGHTHCKTHDNVLMPCSEATPDILTCRAALEHPFVIVDEGQFMPDLAWFLEYKLQRGHLVIVSGLLTDFLRRPFAVVSQRRGGYVCPMSEACLLASETCALTSVCTDCHSMHAQYTLRTTTDTAVEVVGDTTMYRPVCYSCHAQYVSAAAPLASPAPYASLASFMATPAGEKWARWADGIPQRSLSYTACESPLGGGPPRPWPCLPGETSPVSGGVSASRVTSAASVPGSLVVAATRADPIVSRATESKSCDARSSVSSASSPDGSSMLSPARS